MTNGLRVGSSRGSGGERRGGEGAGQRARVGRSLPFQSVLLRLKIYGIAYR